MVLAGNKAKHLSSVNHTTKTIYQFIIGGFNTETSEPRADSFNYEHDLHNLAKEKTCFKSVENPGCTDLILTNNATAFQNTTAVFTGLSDFHKLVLTGLKTSITKSKPQKITYRDYKNFDSVRLMMS